MQICVVQYIGYDTEASSYRVKLPDGQVELVRRQSQSVVMISMGQMLVLVKPQDGSPGYLIPVL